jgi:cytidine deaminase
MREFGHPDLKILLVRSAEEYRVLTLGELLPESFGPEML